MHYFWWNIPSCLPIPLPTYSLAFFFVTTYNIYQAILKLTEKQTHVTRAYFPRRLLYPMCLYYRTTNQLQNKFQRNRVTVKSKKKKKVYDEKEEIGFLDLQTSSVSEKYHLPKHHPQPSAKLPKTLWSLHPFLYNRHEWIIPYVKTYCYTQIWNSFWENLKGYYYTIRKSITWTFSVVTFRVYFCVTCRFYLCT